MKVWNWFLGLPKRTKIVTAIIVSTVVVGTGVGIGVNKHKHSYIESITSPTCTEQGFSIYTCVCGDSYIENYIDKIDHDYKEEIVTSPTCLQFGIKEFTCSNCGDTYTNNFSMAELSASEVFEASKNSVGEIVTYNKNGGEVALGTGFTYSSDGKIITNYHVIEDMYSAKITINGKKYAIQSVLAYDKDIDLAVLKINATNLAVLDICKNNHSVGKAVYAFGSSKGLTATFSQGIITHADRELDGVHYVQHDAAISSGNSGGPLINQYGEVIGINTMTIRDSQNLNFAISVNELDNLIYGTPLTTAQFYEKECDVFTKVKNYVIQKGSYDRSDNEYSLILGYSYPSDYSAKYTREICYDVANDEFSLMLIIDTDYVVAIYIDEIDSVYDWGYLDKNDYYMSGTLYASTYTSNHLLGYSYNNISYSSLRTSVRELASSMVNLLLSYINADFDEIGVTAVDLGFTNY